MLSFLNKKKGIEVKAPLTGTMVPMDQVNDPVFSQKMMGDGVAIQYTGGDIYAPIAGEITAVILPSMHAFGIRSDEGAEILVHVGLETVNLKGECFTLLKKQGERVEAGEKILAVDYSLLASKGIDLITPIILTNGDAFHMDVRVSNKEEIHAKETTVLTLKKK